MENEKQLHTPSIVAKTLSRIDAEHISPRPKWRFWVSEKALWVFFVVSVLVGAAAIAAAIFAIQNIGWKFYLATYDDFASLFFTSLPYLWLCAIIIFTGVGYYNFRQTKRGYRYSLLFILLSSIAASATLGVIFYIFGFGDLVDEEIGRRIPFHRSIIIEERGRLTQPVRGILGGEVLFLDDSDNFTLRAFDGKEWLIDGTDLMDKDMEVLQNYSEVRIVGVPISESASTTGKFHACFVFSWEVVGRSPWRQPPVPVATSAARIALHVNERNNSDVRSNECRGVRPYDALQKVRNTK